MKASAVPLKSIAAIKVSNVDKKTIDGEMPVRLCNYTDVYYNDQIDADMNLMSASATSEQVRTFRLNVNDVVITKDSETPEDIGVASYIRSTSDDMVCGYHLAIIRPDHRKISGRFLYWSLKSDYLRRQFSVAATGVTRFGLRSESISSATILLPPIDEQKAVVAFLDTETVRVDVLIAKKRKLIELLNERIDSLIRISIGESDLIDRQMGRRSTPIRRVLVKMRRTAAVDAEMVTAFRDGQVTARSLRRADGYTQAWSESTQLQAVCEDEIVVHGLDGFAGAIGASEVNGACSPVYHVCRPVDGGDPLYIARMLRILAISGYLGNFATSTRERAFDFRNWQLFGSIPIPDVPVSEQREVGDLIRKLAPLRRAVENSATLADERKNSLITGVIAGEVEVPGVSM